MKLYVISAIIAVLFAVSAAEIVNSRHHSRDARREICVEVEKVKTILRNEHQTKINRSFVFLHHHPHGIPGIPASLIKQSIQDEYRIVDQVKPKNCN